jgi:hypothetical protein
MVLYARAGKAELRCLFFVRLNDDMVTAVIIAPTSRASAGVYHPRACAACVIDLANLEKKEHAPGSAA